MLDCFALMNEWLAAGSGISDEKIHRHVSLLAGYYRAIERSYSYHWQLIGWLIA
jgi:hypothetical protein